MCSTIRILAVMYLFALGLTLRPIPLVLYPNVCNGNFHVVQERANDAYSLFEHLRRDMPCKINELCNATENGPYRYIVYAY